MRLTALPLRIATHAEFLPNGGLRVRIQKELKNSNSHNRSPHWSVKAKERKEWATLILNALVDGLGIAQTLRVVGPGSGLPGTVGGLQCRCEAKPGQKTKRCRCQETLKRRLVITRWVPSTRSLNRDLLNRLWNVKQLQDSITGLGLLRDDADRWCELAVLQRISPDGKFWTEIDISPIAQEASDAA